MTSLQFDQLYSKQCNLMRAFFVRTRACKVIAIGAVRSSDDAGFCVMKARRYERDSSLVASVEKLTGIAVRRSA